MKAIRWAMFLPAALIASIVAGAFGTFMAGLMGEATWFQHTVSGIFSGAAMVLVGAWVAPRPSRGVKWILIALLIVLGALAAVGGLLGSDHSKSLTGLAMLLSGIGAIKLTPAELAQHAQAAFDFELPLTSGPNGTVAAESMSLWRHRHEPECATAEAIVQRFGVVLDDLGARSGGEPHEFVHGWPETFLPFPKAVIQSALLRYTKCLVSAGRLDQKKREALRGGYGALAWFVPETEAMAAARVAEVEISGSDDERMSVVRSPAWEDAGALIDRVLGELAERYKEYAEFVAACEQQALGTRADRQEWNSS